MADGFVTNAGSGGLTFASDDVAGVHYPRVKPSWGVDGSVVDTSVAAPMPVQSSMESSQMTTGGVVVTPKSVAIAASATGSNTIIAAVSGKKIRVLACAMISSGVVNAKFRDGAAGSDKTGLFYLVANTGLVLPFNPSGWFETTANTLLSLDLSAAIAVGGVLTYIEV